MFGRRYFGARFYGPRYFGVGGGSTPPPTLPGDLLEALKLAVRATTTCAGMAGGYSNTSLPRSPTYPCVVGTTRPGRMEFRTDSNDRVLVPINLRVYAESPDQAKALSDSLHEEIKGVLLTFTGALVTLLLPDSEPMSGFIAARTPNGIAHFTERKYCCRVRRPRVTVKA